MPKASVVPQNELVNTNYKYKQKSPRPKPWAVKDPYRLRELMGRIQRAQRAGRGIADFVFRVGTIGRARRNAASGVELDVGSQVGGIVDGRTGDLALFQGPLVGRRVNLAEVVDASVGLRGGTSLHEVRNRDRREEADDGHNDHDFNQRKTRIAEVFVRFHFA